MPDRLPALAADLVRNRITVLVTHDTPATLAAKVVTTTIPIVFLTAADPVEVGFQKKGADANQEIILPAGSSGKGP